MQRIMLIYGGKLEPQKRDQSGDLRGCEQGEEQYLAFCAHCCECDAEIHQTPVHTFKRMREG